MGVQWVFAWKVEKPKARLATRGLSKVHTVEFLEIYAPTLAASSVESLVAIAVENGWELRQLDVKEAFFQADLDFMVAETRAREK